MSDPCDQIQIVFDDEEELLPTDEVLLLQLMDNQRVLLDTMQSLVNLQEMCAALVADRQAEHSVH